MRSIACLLFLLAWGGIGVTMGPDIWLWKQARAWSPGAATFIAVTPAAQSTSGVVEVHYRYQAQGALLESRRIFLSPRWWPPGGTLAELEARFLTNLASQRPMRLWINPQDPTQVALYRNLNWSAMSPYYYGSGAVQVAALGLWFWGQRRARRKSGDVANASLTMTAGITPSDVPHATPHVPPRRQPARRDTRPVESHPAEASAGPRLAVLRAEGGWCVDLRFAAREGVGVDSATLDRLDGQGILRWQDALRINMLSARPSCYVRCPLPRSGAALEQARAYPLDGWQVTFRVRTPEGVQRWSEGLPEDWWR